LKREFQTLSFGILFFGGRKENFGGQKKLNGKLGFVFPPIREEGKANKLKLENLLKKSMYA
jgi:hypothetical protein